MLMGQFDSDRNCWSGLTSRYSFRLQGGLRVISQEIGNVQFHPSDNLTGYQGVEDVIKSAIERLPSLMVWIGHSNGGLAATLGPYKLRGYPIKHVVCVFDRTLKYCPPLEENVIAAMDIWAGLLNLKIGENFKGVLVRRNYGHRSHGGVINDTKAQKEAIAFLKEWI